MGKVVTVVVGTVLSTVNVAVDAADTFQAASFTYNLYSHSVAGAKILVASQAAVVIVAHAVNSLTNVNQAGANRFVFAAVHATIVTEFHHVTVSLVSNTVF